MNAERRELAQKLFVRVCHDSGFGLDAIRAAHLTAKILGCSPLEIWIAMPSLSVMDEIAAGTHPAVKSRAPSNPIPSQPEQANERSPKTR